MYEGKAPPVAFATIPPATGDARASCTVDLRPPIKAARPRDGPRKRPPV